MQNGYQMDPNLQGAILGIHGQNAKDAQMQRQLQLANSLRANSLQGYQPQMAGRVVVPGAGLASAIGSMAQAYGGKKLGESAEQGLQASAGERAKLYGQYFGALTGQRPRPQQPAMPGVPNPAPGGMPGMGPMGPDY